VDYHSVLESDDHGFIGFFGILQCESDRSMRVIGSLYQSSICLTYSVSNLSKEFLPLLHVNFITQGYNSSLSIVNLMGRLGITFRLSESDFCQVNFSI
jgi:hypothetical protein